jgi:2-polyprenyl-6-methoxyphenol hydroxylase-like FAD-dependent oxidoreductase
MERLRRVAHVNDAVFANLVARLFEQRVAAAAAAAGRDPLTGLPEYERRRSADRLAIRSLTRTIPGFFATRFGPAAAARSLGLTLLSIFPDLRAEFARFLMFGVRS